jgi:orotidine-5'-phosphate decarboxylase
VEPFLQSARRDCRGVFVLVRTSNPGSGQFQDLESGGRPLFLHVAEAVGTWARENVGRCGFGDVGAVVGATHAAELAAVRRALPDAVFLIPGYGAQGGTAADTAAGFRPDGLGAVVNSARGIIGSFRPEDRAWENAVERATRDAIAELSRSTPMGRLAASQP